MEKDGLMILFTFGTVINGEEWMMSLFMFGTVINGEE